MFSFKRLNKTNKSKQIKQNRDIIVMKRNDLIFVLNSHLVTSKRYRKRAMKAGRLVRSCSSPECGLFPERTGQEKNGQILHIIVKTELMTWLWTVECGRERKQRRLVVFLLLKHVQGGNGCQK